MNRAEESTEMRGKRRRMRALEQMQQASVTPPPTANSPTKVAPTKTVKVDQVDLGS